ncbi:hypothetical protein BT96DRAFT_270275 [Gymnopus androsaceus JB14]|uniref:PB1 domain-containing protein n=1 Tax=Gymnopus androsaceus JB14 TaxID=1447944 RepID=A0A6A4I8J8_9AGAR|nr:hypothetical protein BT96DRAFT_270275 [Gymnopus androsaceus JB14]
MRCRSEDQMRQWESTINRLVREFAQRQASPRFLRLGRWQTPDPQSSIPPYLSSIQEGYESSGDHRTGIPPTLMYSTAVPSPLPLWNPRRHVSIGRSNVGSGSNESTGNSSDYSTDSSLPMTPYGSSESSLAGGSSDVHPKKRSQWQMSKNTFYAEANHAPFAQPVNVKVHFHEDIFIIQVPHTMEFDDLVKMVGRKIQLCGPRRDGGPLRVKYRDKDGDMVSLRSTEDIQMAFEEYQLDGQVPLFVV